MIDIDEYIEMWNDHLLGSEGVNDLMNALIAEVKRLREENDIIDWAKKTHPVWLDNLKEGYKRHREAKKNEIKE